MSRSRQFIARRLARLLFWTPLLCVAPVFFYVGENVPDLNHGNIADGFRKLNAAVSTLAPLTAVCWILAFVLTAFVDVLAIPKQRWTIWMAIFVGMIFLTRAPPLTWWRGCLEDMDRWNRQAAPLSLLKLDSM